MRTNHNLLKESFKYLLILYSCFACVFGLLFLEVYAVIDLNLWLPGYRLTFYLEQLL